MTMKAQPAIDTSTADAPKYYVIASYSRGGVLTNAGVNQALTRTDLADAGYWYFEKANDEGGVHIVNKVKDGENKVYVGSELKASTTAAVWYILPNGVNNAGLSISKTAAISNYSCIDANNYDTGVGTWQPSADDDWDGTTWVVSEEKNRVNVVYNFTYGDADKGSETAKVATAVGYEYPAITKSFPFGISAAKPEGNITETDAVDGVVTKTIALEDNLPFVPAADYASIENWYCLKFHANQQNYLYYDGTEKVLDATKTAVDANNKDAYAWAFIGNPFDGFKVVNKLAGAEKYLNAVEAGAVIGTAEQAFILTASGHGTNGFFMQAMTGDYKDRFNKQNGKVVYWSGADAGSTFMVEAAPEVLSYTLTDVFGNEYTGTYLGVAGETQPTLPGAAGCTFNNVVWDGTAFTANVVFPFPVSDENTTKAVMISSHNGTSLFWRAEGDNITAQKDAVADSENYYWAIYPAYAEGSFTFTIKNLGTGKFIYSTSAENKHDQGVVTLADEGSAFTVETNNKFKLATGKYLSINSATDTKVQVLGTWGDHGGTHNQFVAYSGLAEEVVAAFNEQASTFAALESEALSSLPALQAQWAEVKGEVASLSTAIEAGNYVTNADVDAAVASMTAAKAAIEPVVTYYTETFVAKKEAADAAMAELDEASEQYATLTEAIDVATVTTVAELEAKVAAIDTVLDYIANLPGEEPGDESAWAPSVVGNGTFYLYNVGADMFMCSGNHWGSRASVTGGGVPMTLAGEGNVYSISAGALFKDGFLGTDGGGYPFMDCGSQNWTFELVSENVYKIVKDGSYLFWNGEGTTYLNCGADPNTEASQWMLYTEEARIAYLANATAADPIDATFLIKNAYFAKGNGRIVAKDADLTNSPSWKGTTLTDLWGVDSNDPAACYAVEQYGKQFDNYQELTNVPNGVYYMTAKGFYRGTVVPYIYANDEKCALKPLTDGDANSIGTGAKALTSDKYLLEGVKVTVEDGTLRVGIKSDEKIDWCVFDDFQLTYYGAPEWATDEQKQALSEAIAEAEGHILGFAAGEYAPYTNVEALKTLAAAKAVDADNALAGEITAVLETLAAAVWTENAEEMNAIYDGSFEYAYSTNGNVQPIAWHGINNHDNATDIRYMWDASANAGLTATSTDKALFTKYNAFYGTEEGYTMPLKENTEYELTFIYGGWNDCQKDGYVTITGPEDAVIELSTDRLPLDAVDGHQNAESWKTYTATFTTGAAGNYVLGLRKDREVEGKQSQYVYGDFKLYAVPAAPQYLTVVGANVGDVAIVEGTATVSSISTIDVIFDRPVAKAENAGWATLADKWDNNTLQVEVLEAEEGSSEYVVRFSVWDWMGEFTEAGDYILTIPEGLIVGANGTNYINETITATITIETSASASLTVTNVTVGEDVMTELSAIVATPADMIKVNFDGEFYFQGMPTIMDAENKDASEYFQYTNGRDLDGSNSYIFMAQNWQETAAPAGVYTITLPKASFMEMMQYKAPVEDIVLTVQIIADEEPEVIEVTAITLNTTWSELNEVGDTLKLTATVTPENATDATITWSSSHPEIATVVDGLVTIVAAAQEQVEIKATAANGVSASCWLTVYVVEPGTVTGITLNATWRDLEVKSGDTFQLVATVEPADATDKTVTWTSSADFATVDANGLVTFNGTPEDGGTVTITATASNGMTAQCMLSVTFVENEDTAIDNIKADSETVIYDIHGRRVTEMTKGVYIVNGKKVIKK